ncbi:putative leader peptide [Amycolatopsis ultiminotia]|uniref:putative leader peptide n=1 Tax=Amycolatopsis ultiminotia TaxID=543629 RepID=UPI003CD08508
MAQNGTCTYTPKGRVPSPSSAVAGSPAGGPLTSGTGTTAIVPGTGRPVRTGRDSSAAERCAGIRPGRRTCPVPVRLPGNAWQRWPVPPGSEPSPTIRTTLDHILNAWQSGAVSPAGFLLVARRHVDLVRVASALCRPVR